MLALKTRLWRAEYKWRALRSCAVQSPRIFVIETCQGGAVARVMRHLLPEGRIDFVSVYEAMRRFPRLNDLMAHIDGYDAAFSSGS